jgi:hypothetical protein
MGLFHIRSRKTKPVLNEDLLTALDLRVATLEAKVRTVDVEWTEMYDKFRRLHMRLSKRDQRDEDAPGSPNGDPGGQEIGLGAQRLLGRL